MKKRNNFTVAVLIFTLISLQSFSQNCDEKAVEQSNEVKRTVENSLINSTSMTKITSNQEELTVFYHEGKLIKISATDNMSQNEEVFFNNGMLRYYSVSGYRDGNQFMEICYFSDDVLRCYEDGLKGEYRKFDKEFESRILTKVNRYLEEIQ